MGRKFQTKVIGRELEGDSLQCRVRVSGGHLCEAEAPTEPTGETMSAGQRVRVAVGETLCLKRVSLDKNV